MRCIDCDYEIPEGRLKYSPGTKRCAKCEAAEFETPHPAPAWQPPVSERDPRRVDRDLYAKAIVKAKKKLPKSLPREKREANPEEIRQRLDDPAYLSRALDAEDAWRIYQRLKREKPITSADL